jgi:hypothetical protein
MRTSRENICLLVANANTQREPGPSSLFHDVLLSTCLHHRHILCEHRQHSEMRTAATIPILTFLVYTVVLGQDEFNTQHVATSGVSRRFGFHHMGSSFATPADTSVEVANQPHPIITSKPYAYDFRISSSI